MRLARAGAAAIAGAAVLILAAAYVFQDNISQFWMNPRTPYQTYTPPPAPDYARNESWVARPGPDAPGVAEIFYVHGTTYYSRAGWNAPLDDPKASALLERTALPNQAGPFSTAGRIWAPRYRQATLYSVFTHKHDSRAARQTAYLDIDRAFDAFLLQSDPKRPIVLAGYDQGGLYVLRLLEERFQRNDALHARLAAAYVINQPVPRDLFATLLPHTRLCAAPDDLHCVVAWTGREAPFKGEIRRLRERGMTWDAARRLAPVKGRALACVNPLTWTATDDYAPPAKHDGAASATGLDPATPPVPVRHAVGAQCRDGILVIDSPKENWLRRRALFGAKWRMQTFNLFYADIRQNALARVAAWQAWKVREQTLPPIKVQENLPVSPINKVPD